MVQHIFVMGAGRCGPHLVTRLSELGREIVLAGGSKDDLAFVAGQRENLNRFERECGEFSTEATP